MLDKTRKNQDMPDKIKILFVCHGNILKSPGKAYKINGYAADMALTTPILHHFLKEPCYDKYIIKRIAEWELYIKQYHKSM